MSAADQPWAKALGDVMTLLREIKGMGLREHARAIGLNPATLSRIEQGKGCDVDQLVKIHKATSVSYDRLLGSARIKESK